MTRPKIVFLYSEIAGYFLASVEALSKKADILIIRWEINKEAPFEFTIPKGVKVIVKTDLSLNELSIKVHNFKPDIVVCSGWMDKDYLKIVKSFKKKIPAVLTLDNHWTGSIKQRLAGLLSPFIFKDKFTHTWVPGQPQKLFAEKLGFDGKILLGFYCADVRLYDSIYKQQNSTFKKQFLYVGRYVKHKGIFEMWQAFVELQNESPNDWQMLCIGTGEEWDNKIEHEKIKHVGFVQPSAMTQYLTHKSVYMLPSQFEPWGVTVHEFAVTSCPLILSKNVGAHELFLEPSKNGVLLNEVSVKELKKGMKLMMDKSDTELLEMSQKSHEMGLAYRPDIWADRLLSLVK